MAITSPTLAVPRPNAALAPASRLRGWRPFSRSEYVAGLIALLLGGLHQMILPNSGTDLAAQLARASFARAAPLTPVDLSWYSGVHPFGYSLLTPWIMAVVGVGTAGLIAAVAAAVLFARLVRDLRYPVVSAVLGAVFSVADVASGRTTFALSAVALLAALLVRERRGWAVLFAVLAGLASPVGAAFLALCALVLVLHRRPGGWTLGLAAVAPVLILAALFPNGGIQPFSVAPAIPAVAIAVALALLTKVPMVRTGSLLYAVAVVFFAFHHDPVGSNILRLGLLVAAPLFVATARLPTAALVVASVGVLIWQLGPVLDDLEATPGPQLAALSSELVSLGSNRVEIVAPRDHGESWAVAQRVSLARGWSRQIDYRDNPLFYEGTLTGPEYAAWLRAHGVDHVAVPRRATIDFGGAREAALLTHSVSGLTKVWSDRDWTVYRVTSPGRLVSAPARVVSSTRTTLTLSSSRPGDVAVVVRWSRWLSLSGPGCIEKDGDQVKVHFASPGTVVLGSALVPHGHC